MYSCGGGAIFGALLKSTSIFTKLTKKVKGKGTNVTPPQGELLASFRAACYLLILMWVNCFSVFLLFLLVFIITATQVRIFTRTEFLSLSLVVSDLTRCAHMFIPSCLGCIRLCFVTFTVVVVPFFMSCSRVFIYSKLSCKH